LDPVLIEVPDRVESERLVLRCSRAGDGAALNAAVCASVEVLRPWMPWVSPVPTVDDSEAYCRREQAKFLLREELAFLLFEKGSDGPDGPVLGAVGLHRIDWSLRTFEMGYWRRIGLEGFGIVSEAVAALSRVAFDRLSARRVEIRMDESNERSRRVAERAGFTFEGLLRLDSATPAGSPRSTRVSARIRGVEEPSSDVAAAGS
jgi:RimJ/RimL family protein N-acetyltransferase